VAYHQAVEYIEKMKPAYVDAVAEELKQVAEGLKAILPTVTALPGRMDWDTKATEICERRLNESIDLAEKLYDGFTTAGTALDDYAQAQTAAMSRVAEGAAAERSLGVLIADIAATQSVVVRWADPLGQWNDLRNITSAADLVMELSHRDAINAVRDEADALWTMATTAYDDALRLETNARKDTARRLESAYRSLPDFLADSNLAVRVIASVPGVHNGLPPEYFWGEIGPPTPPNLTFKTDFPYDPAAHATVGDIASREKWMLRLDAARLARPDLDDATAAYARYMADSGEPMVVDLDEAYAEDNGVRRTVDTIIRDAQDSARQHHEEEGLDRFEMTSPAMAAALRGHDTATETENWQKTLGDYTVWDSAQVVVDGNQATMRIKIHAEDQYDFNKDSFDRATHISDDENGRFATLGWAKEFRTSGSVERTVTWSFDDPEPPFDPNLRSTHRPFGVVTGGGE
jgi:hypothetical protein